MSGSNTKLTSILKKRKPLEDVELREPTSTPELQQAPYFAAKELFCLDPLIKYLRGLKKPSGMFSVFSASPPLDLVSLCFCKYCFALGLSDGSVVLVDQGTGDHLSHTMVLRRESIGA